MPPCTGINARDVAKVWMMRAALRTAWPRAVLAWKGAVGLGTLSWAAYGTLATCALGHVPGSDAYMAFAAGALAGGWSGAVQGSGSRQTLT